MESNALTRTSWTKKRPLWTPIKDVHSHGNLAASPTTSTLTYHFESVSISLERTSQS